MKSTMGTWAFHEQRAQLPPHKLLVATAPSQGGLPLPTLQAEAQHGQRLSARQRGHFSLRRSSHWCPSEDWGAAGDSLGQCALDEQTEGELKGDSRSTGVSSPSPTFYHSLQGDFSSSASSEGVGLMALRPEMHS